MLSPEAAAEWLFVAFVAVATAGVLAAAGVIIYWRSVGEHVSDSWPKLVAEGVQLVVGVASAAAGFAAADQKLHWFRPAVAGVVCVGLWKLLQVLIDNRVKAADAARKVELAVVQRQATNAARLLAVLHGAVKQKVKRVRKMIRRGRPPRLTNVRDALTPRPHLEELLDGIATFFCEQLPEGDRQVRNFRVGVYVVQNGVLTPVHHGVSYRDPGDNPFSSFQAHPDHYSLASTDPSVVVQCVRQRGLILVEDCGTAAAAGTFRYFNDDQPNYLRSMACYFLGAVCLPDATMTSGALVIDTDAPGFFKESDRDAIRYCFLEFGIRIKLELLLLALVDRQGATDEPRIDSGGQGEASRGDPEAPG